MADVLPPLMQNTSTITMLHTRPSSADAFQGSTSQYSQQARLSHAPRAMYTGQNVYKGQAAVQPYAFQSTPNLRQETRTISAPASSHGAIGGHRHASSLSTSSSDTGSVPSSGKDDSVIGSRPSSAINLSAQLPDLSFTPFDTQSVKPSPERYHRPTAKRTDSSNTVSSHHKSAAPSGSGMASVGHLYQQSVPKRSSADDMSINKSTGPELAKRYRRRSLNTLDTHINQPSGEQGIRRPSIGNGATSTPTTIRPVSFYSNHSGSEENELGIRSGSATSLHKVESGKGSVHSQESIKPVTSASRNVVVPPRVSSEPNKRLASPSPLSRLANETESPAKTKSYAAVAAQAQTVSPAAKQLAALSDKDLNKGMKSRLRRAFSFGSAQELRRASGENGQNVNPATLIKEQHQNRIEDDMDAEQLEIARRQEAAGIGAGIYSGQGGFIGSTDNLSISSTASSASMMLRKMGQGARKGARSIKGLFRPKSVIGVPSADAPIVQPSVGQVSMVTVEAERHRVNVNERVSDTAGGVTGFPKLERNSLDASNVASLPSPVRGSAEGSDTRRSIVGSDRDRAEVLAAVKKGILKRSGTSSPNGSPVIRASDGTSPGIQVTESPASSRPGTPNHGVRSGSFNGDYFNQRMGSKNMPNASHSSLRSISFSPRIQFHEAWAATEYDRRGEIATCNRLTPMLAQQIKEELNTFKMEMEVHELSKPHTHFF
ncbi:Hypothetical protein R9X50_00640700 [Acrodontium crateriforme]|uniref:Protein BNI4 n=1 Tax=Acrodontium crateriforme TaxID=150365 RepID=A0AAQ3MD87_9PEZI|nr:Hypothetical protein R9X50_00640700 [Acrodontium crateriforme]